jgi:PST family polysaccharide transporter
MTIFRYFGAEGNGIYNAAWALSAQFAGFILGAMYNDYFPRLSAAKNDHVSLNAMVNEQTEIGLLMALPGLMATLAFAPWLVQLLYSQDFSRAADLLPWLVLGVFGRIVGWPLGYVMLVTGSTLTYALFELFQGILHVALVYVAARNGSLEGVAVAFAFLQAIFIVAIYIIARRLTDFSWSSNCRQLFGTSLILLLATFPVVRFLPTLYAILLTAGLTCITSIICLRAITWRLGPGHRITRIASRIPFLAKCATL